jgi:hypothetical protein
MTHLMSAKHLPVVLFTMLYVLGFGVWFVSEGNSEFMWYMGVLVAILILAAVTLPQTKFPQWLLWLLSFWGLAHLAGGGIRIGDTVLYGTMVWPVFDGGGDFVLFKYDQLVHAYGFGVAALAVYTLLARTMIGTRTFWIATTAVLVSMGLSVVNEIVEFIPVLLLPDTWVGGYYNIALDLVFNTLGAGIAVTAYALLKSKQ